MKKILIVDDSSFMRTILKELLTDKSDEVCLSDSVEIFEADGKAEARKKLNKVKPDLILLDIVMKESETEGIEFIREIKDIYDTHNIIVISSIGQVAVLDECKKLGITTYLQKPFDKSQVIDAVDKVLAACK